MEEKVNETKIETPEERHLRHKIIRARKHRKRRKKIRIATFCMAFGIFVQLFSLFTYVGIYGNEILNRSINQSNYAENVYKDIYKKVEALSIKNNLPVDVFENEITPESVNLCLKYIQTEIFKVSSPKLNTETLVSKIHKNVINYLKLKKVEINHDVEESVSLYAQECGKIFENNIVFNLVKVINKSKAFSLLAFAGISVFNITIVTISAIIIFGNISSGHKMLRSLSISLSTSSILMFIASIVVRFRLIPIRYIGTGEKYKYELVNCFFNNLSHIYFWCSVVCFIISLVFILAWIHIVSNKSADI